MSDLSKYEVPLAEYVRGAYSNPDDFPLEVWQQGARDLLASPVVARVVAEAKAEAWDEGLTVGATTLWYPAGEGRYVSRAYTSGDPNAPNNPYRAEASGREGERWVRHPETAETIDRLGREYGREER